MSGWYDVQARLRTATQEAHLSLHRHPLLRPLAAGEAAPADYARALAGFRRALAALVRRCPDLDAVVAVGERTRAIDADLAALGAALPESERHGAEEEMPVEAFALGVAYVVAGAGNGARIMAPRLCGQGLPTAFLSGQDISGGEWERLAGWLGALSDDGVAAAVDGAVWAFGQYRAALDAA